MRDDAGAFQGQGQGDGVFIDDVKENGIKLSNLKSKGTFTSGRRRCQLEHYCRNLTEYAAVFPRPRKSQCGSKNLYNADKALISPAGVRRKTGDGDMTGGTLRFPARSITRIIITQPPVSVRFGRHVCRLHGSVQQHDTQRRYDGRDLEDEQAHHLHADRHRQPRTYRVRRHRCRIGMIPADMEI